jgi:hypothetical protein
VLARVGIKRSTAWFCRQIASGCDAQTARTTGFTELLYQVGALKKTERPARPRRRRSFIQEIGAFRKTLAAIALREHERDPALEHLTLLSQEIVSAISRLRRSGPGVRLLLTNEEVRKAV